ncbi:MAG: FAD-binding oxidoreductase [Alphaproteobacteria bacterium]|nr:MAG: FAD-binding oxidoreductase [Alphaproteobacteria bacterium]
MAPQGRVIVIGAGVFGLWCAWECLARGFAVTVIDRGGPGAGASGGVVGALAPHRPEPWTAEKAFQIAALRSLPRALAGIEAVSGIACGWRRVGRAQPLADAPARRRAEALAEAAARHWPGVRVRILPPGAMAHWIDPAAAPAGILHEELTARLDPAATCRALARAVARRGGRFLRARALAVAPGRVDSDAGRLSGDAVVIAAGADSFALAGLPGGAVKGQAALLAARPGVMPVISARETWIVAHQRPGGGVAVGSTREESWHDAAATDARLDGVIARARAICPPLRTAPVLRRWAGLRPRAASRKPLIGPLPGAGRVLLCTGGLGISFAIGQRAGAAIAALIAGTDPDLPEIFLPARAIPSVSRVTP